MLALIAGSVVLFVAVLWSTEKIAADASFARQAETLRKWQ